MNIWTTITVTNKFTFKKRKYEESYTFYLDDGRIILNNYSLYCNKPLKDTFFFSGWGPVMFLSGERDNTFYFKSDHMYDWVKTELPSQTRWKKLSNVEVSPEIYEEVRKELLKFCNSKHR